MLLSSLTLGTVDHFRHLFVGSGLSGLGEENGDGNKT